MRFGRGRPGGATGAVWNRPSDPPTGLTEEQRYLLDLQGFVVLPAVLDAEQVAYLHRVLDERRLPAPSTSIQSQRFNGFLVWDEAFRDLLVHPRVLPVMAEMVGDRLRLDHCYGIAMAPGTDGLGLHGGGAPFDAAQYALHRDGRMFHGLSVAMYALVDADEHEGGFLCVPGSHKAHHPLPPGAEHLGIARQVPHRAGDVIVFTEALTHGTARWLAPVERRHLLYKYSPGHLSWAVPEPIPPDLDALLDDRQRTLLGPPSVASRRPLL
jgi:ectoine hydroxylase-related dioxygenase (phytanoyl-CoA dioxygenase family)